MNKESSQYQEVPYWYCWKVSVLVASSCQILCDPMDCNLPGSSVYGTSQARILESVAIPFSRGSSEHRDQTPVSRITGRFFTIWATREAPMISLKYSYSIRDLVSSNCGVGEDFWESLGLQGDQTSHS